MPTILSNLANRVEPILRLLPEWLIALLIRIAISSVFWRSAQTKISGWELFGQNWKFWNLSESTFLLFAQEYRVPLLPSDLAAYLATFGEYFLSLAIVLGLATRLSALGLLAMTTVIQLFVYPEAWNVHILWVALLAYLLRYGAGSVSVDRLIGLK